MSGHHERHTALTRRQVEIATLVARGLSDGEIARQLAVSPGTVAQHVERIQRKLGVATRAHIATQVPQRR